MRMPLLAPQLRIPALLLAGALISGIGLLLWGLGYHTTSETALVRDAARESEAALAAREAPTKLRRSREEANMYERLHHNGFLGSEQRTGWVTALGQVRTSLKLDSLSWRLAPRARSPLAPGLRVSSMDLSASGVDAVVLDAMLKDLRKAAPGRFTVEACTLAMNPDGASGQAECRLNWWTWEDVQPLR